MKNMLVLIEGIADQDYLLNDALKMAKCWGANLVIGHVLPPTDLVFNHHHTSQNVKQIAQLSLEKEHIIKLLNLLKEHRLVRNYISIKGNSIQSLLKAIDEYKIDFLVTQTVTRSWIQEKMNKYKSEPYYLLNPKTIEG